VGGPQGRPRRWRSQRTVFCMVAVGDRQRATAEAEVRQLSRFCNVVFALVQKEFFGILDVLST